MPEQPLPAPREPNGSRVFALLLKLGIDLGDAYAFVQEVQSMTAENRIARFESRLEVTAASLESKVDVQTAELRSFKWFIGAEVVFALFFITLVQFLLAARGSA